MNQTRNQIDWLVILSLVDHEKMTGKKVEIGESEFDKKLKEAQNRSRNKQKLRKTDITKEQEEWIKELKQKRGIGI